MLKIFVLFLAFDVDVGSYRKRDVETTLRSNNDLTLTKRRNIKQQLYQKSEPNTIHENKISGERSRSNYFQARTQLLLLSSLYNTIKVQTFNEFDIFLVLLVLNFWDNLAYGR